MPRETGKQRKARIEPDYFARPDPLARRRRRILTAVLIAIAAALVLAPSWTRDRASPRIFVWNGLASHGELARPHASWEGRCEACHVPWTPINGSRWSPLAAGSREGDRRCASCHDAAPHAKAERPDEVSSCADCHRDHQGRDASLVRLDDATCTRCHADLPSHRRGDGTSSTISPHVSAFPANHPEFRSTPDPGHVAFNHSRHLAPLPVVTPTGDETTRQLVCASCHRPDESGRRMEPVSYDNNCRSCHPLTFDPNLPDRVARHGTQPRELVAELQNLYLAEASRADPARLRRPLPPRPMPGQTADPDAETSLAEAASAKLRAALRELFVRATPGNDPDGSPRDRRGCLLCHDATDLPDGPITAEAVASLTIDPRIPTSWFPRARFDHASHRHLSCDSCHAEAPRSPTAADRLLPARATCAQCHAPAPDRLGHADHSCVECHRYHPVTQKRGRRELSSK